MSNRPCSVILAAGGSGSRFGAPFNKIFADLAGSPVLSYSLRCFLGHPAVKEIVIACRGQDRERIEEIVQTVKKEISCGNIPVSLTEGGADRRSSVAKALLLCHEAYVLVHDAARPLVTAEMIDSCLTALASYEAVSAAVPSRDTVKIANENREVLETPDRSGLWLIQTPQGFCRDALLKAQKSVPQDGSITDDCALMERSGKDVKLVPGSYRNIKVTEAEDIAVLTALLAQKP